MQTTHQIRGHSPHISPVLFAISSLISIAMIAGITFIEAFVEEPGNLYTFLEGSVTWDERMTARKTASCPLRLPAKKTGGSH
jgi:hypothetical protein